MSLLYTDGASRGNPGPAAGGWSLHADDGSLLDEGACCFVDCTNNEAEYRALLQGLNCVHAHKLVSIEIRLDSELIVKQLQGLYRVKHAGLRVFYSRALELLQPLTWRVMHIPRAQNARADQLANEALDGLR